MPDPVYPTVRVMIYDPDPDEEVDFSPWVVGDIVGSHGIFSNRDVDRLASPGRLTFNIYDLGGSLVGCPVRILVTVGVRTKQVWYGYIVSQIPDSGEWGPRRTKITALDWVNVAQKTRLRGVELQTNIRADEAVEEVLQLTPNQPAYLDLEKGYETFANMFDGMSTSKTTVYAELDRIVKSELGYLYLRFRDADLGETLRMEDLLARGIHRPLKELPVDITHAYNLKWRGPGDVEGHLYWRNPDDDGLILLYDTTTRRAVFDKTMVSSDWRDGENVINQMSVTNIPRATSSVAELLYTLDKPILIGTSEKRAIISNYRNPDGGALIQAFDIITPILGLDVLFNSKVDGSGSDLTSNLIVQFTPNSNNFAYSVLNKGEPGYITKLEIWGSGIYKYHPIETIFDNTKSKEQTVRTEVNASMQREYSSDYRISEMFARQVVGVNWAPLKLMQTADFIANYSLENMIAFLYCDVGDKVQIAESRPDHVGNYYIQGIKFVIRQGGIIEYTWHLKEGMETLCEPFVLNGPVASAVDAVDFGILPYMSNMEAFSVCFWMRMNGNDAHGFLVDRSVDDGTGRRGWMLSFPIHDGRIYFVSYKTPTDGSWRTTNPVIVNQDQWYHVAVTYTNADTANPTFYIDGSEVVSEELSTPSGPSDDDSDCPLILLNSSLNPATTMPYLTDTDDIGLKDVRIYSRRISRSEVEEIYSAPNDYTVVQDGLIFCGPYCPVWNREEYINDTIDDGDYVIEIARGAVGVPYNDDTSDPDLVLTGEEI